MAKKKWIQGAIKHPGALHKQLGVPEGEKIPASKMAAAREGKYGAKAKQRANFAKTLKSFDEGGTVPGPVGAPVPILAHGGEQVIPVRPHVSHEVREPNLHSEEMRMHSAGRSNYFKTRARGRTAP